MWWTSFTGTSNLIGFESWITCPLTTPRHELCPEPSLNSTLSNVIDRTKIDDGPSVLSYDQTAAIDGNGVCWYFRAISGFGRLGTQPWENERREADPRKSWSQVIIKLFQPLKDF